MLLCSHLCLAHVSGASILPLPGHRSVSFEKFLQMCDTDLTEGGGSFAKRNIRQPQKQSL